MDQRTVSGDILLDRKNSLESRENTVLVDDRIFLLQYSCILYGAAAKRSEGAGHAGRTDMAEGYGRGV